MKNIYRFLAVCTILTGAVLTLPAQPIRTAYFMDKTIERTALNPAFQPERGYFSVPFIGSFGASATSNQLTVNNLFYPRQGGGLVTFLDQSVSPATFLNNLRNNNQVNADFHLDLIKGGWYSGKAFWSYGLGLRATMSLGVPKSMFEFIKLGTGAEGSIYDISDLSGKLNSYLEVSVGYSRPIGERWTVGGKLKLLPGIASAGVQFDHLHAELTPDKWRITSRGQLYTSMKGLTLNEETDDEGRRYVNDAEFGTPGMGGFGAAIDLGASFKLLDNLTLSASVIDLGFISWSKKATQYSEADGTFNFEGFNLPIGDQDGTTVSDQLSELTSDIENLFHFKKQENVSRTTMLAATLLFGAEYAILDNRISFGLLSTTRFYSPKAYTELTASANFRPVSWFATSLSYSMLHGYNTFGFALNFSPKGFNFFLGTDYMVTRITPQGVPIHNKGFNVCMGMSIQVGRKACGKR